MIPKEFIDDLNKRVDLAAFLGQYIPDLKKKGANYQACCPFHAENTASFTVTPNKGFYHCFGCGANGNAINFLMEKDGLSFLDAVETVANFVGIQLPETKKKSKPPIDKQEAIRYTQACAVMSTAQSIYAKALSEKIEPQAYLLERGLSEQSIIKFELGYAPNEWHAITGLKQLKKEALDDAGLSVKAEESTHTYDRFRNRIMFPIHGYKDRIVGYGARAINDDQKPKYLNSPETILFKKGEVLYGLKQGREAIRKFNRVFVVEGYMDVVMLSQFGVENVVATLGTAVTEAQIRKLLTLCNRITFCLDGDQPGQEAAFRAAENTLPHINDQHVFDFMFMPENCDPDEFVQKFGKEGFERESHKVVTLSSFLLNRISKMTDFRDTGSFAVFLATTIELSNKVHSNKAKLALQMEIAECCKQQFS